MLSDGLVLRLLTSFCRVAVLALLYSMQQAGEAFLLYSMQQAGEDPFCCTVCNKLEKTLFVVQHEKTAGEAFFYLVLRFLHSLYNKSWGRSFIRFYIRLVSPLQAFLHTVQQTRGMGTTFLHTWMPSLFRLSGIQNNHVPQWVSS